MINYTQLVQDVQDGNEDPLKAYVELMKLQKSIEEAIKYIKDEAINAASNYGKEKFEKYGYEIKYNQGRKIWDFKNIRQWNEYKQKLAEVEEFGKLAYSAYEKGGQFVDPDTGEIIPVPIVTHSNDYITVTKLK